MNLLAESYAGNTLFAWLVAGSVWIALVLAMRLVQTLVMQRLDVAAKRTRTEIDDIVVSLLRRTRWFFPAAIALYVAAQLLVLPIGVVRGVHIVVVVLLLAQAAIWGNTAINLWVSRTTVRCVQDDAARTTTITALGYLARVLLWSFILLLALDNMGFNVTTLIAGLGITGIAVALAVQNILGDLFASLSIMLDKPFVLGDFIVVDNYMGKVEYIGLKTTRVRSLFGEQIVFSNTDLLKSRVRNYKRMLERRVVFPLAVTYENPIEKLRLVPKLVQEAIEAQPHARFGSAHFKEFRDFALSFEVAYFIDTADYAKYMNIQQAINLAIFEKFHAREIEFAHHATAHTQKLPSRTAAQESTA